MDGRLTDINLLASGFYTVSDAARLIEVGSAQRILGWLRGYPRRDIGPLLTRDFPPIAGTQELSFLDLMEVRFVEHFREQGVKVRTLRRSLETARKVFGEPKPLATSKIRFVARQDKRDVFVEEVLRPVAEETGDRKLWSLITKQYEIYEFIRDRLASSIRFDPDTALANRWIPRPNEFPEIVIDPRVAYGQPIVPGRVPTRALFDAWRAEDENLDAVADWFDVPVTEAKMAVAFEQLLLKPRRAVVN